MSRRNRRAFLARATSGMAALTLTADAGAQTGGRVSREKAKALPPPADLGPAGLAKKYWLDPRLQALPSRPWRKIHLDFHNSQHVPKIGEHFNADEWGDCLEAAHVNAIVVFAKDMHGYFYYPSAYGPVHPGLDFDLLGAQVAACRKRKIAAYAYYCTTWDNYLADHHPEWLVFKRDRTSYLPKFDQVPRWTALCLVREPFVELMLTHAREFVTRYELDGAWFDMPVPVDGECFCDECVRQLRSRGLDPFDKRVQRQHKHELHLSFIERVHKVVTTARPGCQVDFNGQGVYGLARRVPFMDNVDIEALPTGQWGYHYFPTVARYTRTFGLTTYGMTGRFKAAWADFGGLKLPAQLDTELAGIVAHGARCDIGDQMPPKGRLDPAVYHVIGKAYGRIKELEPYLDQAVPVTEAALIVNGLPLDGPDTEAHYGLVKLMTESRLQFDLVDSDAGWERYALVVLPDELEVDEKLAARLLEFVNQGGAVLVVHQSGLLAGTEKSWLESLGMSYAGPSPFKPAYLIPHAGLSDDIPTYEYALYEGASQWKVQDEKSVLAVLGEPAFQRSAEHYTSHAQSPFDHATQYAALARSGRVGLAAFPIGRSYYSQGYWIYRRAFQKVVSELLPAPLLQSNAPLSTEITLTHQSARAEIGRKERYLVHVVNFSPLRRTPKHPDFYEDPVPLTDVTIRLNIGVKATTARAVVAASDLAIRRTPAGGVEVMVERVPVHEIVAIEVA